MRTAGLLDVGVGEAMVSDAVKLSPMHRWLSRVLSLEMAAQGA